MFGVLCLWLVLALLYIYARDAKYVALECATAAAADGQMWTENTSKCIWPRVLQMPLIVLYCAIRVGWPTSGMSNLE
jgi:hypothetical protein